MINFVPVYLKALKWKYLKLYKIKKKYFIEIS